MTEVSEDVIAAASIPTTLTFEGETHRFVLGFAEACRLEDKIGRPFATIIADLSENPSLIVLREIFRVALDPRSGRGGFLSGWHMGGGIQAGLTADRIIAALGIDRATILIAYHAEGIVQAIRDGTGGVEVAGVPIDDLSIKAGEDVAA